MKNFSESDLQTFYCLTVQKIIGCFQMNELYSLIFPRTNKFYLQVFWISSFHVCWTECYRTFITLRHFPRQLFFCLWSFNKSIPHCEAVSCLFLVTRVKLPWVFDSYTSEWDLVFRLRFSGCDQIYQCQTKCLPITYLTWVTCSTASSRKFTYWCVKR